MYFFSMGVPPLSGCRVIRETVYLSPFIDTKRYTEVATVQERKNTEMTGAGCLLSEVPLQQGFEGFAE